MVLFVNIALCLTLGVYYEAYLICKIMLLMLLLQKSWIGNSLERHTLV